MALVSMKEMLRKADREGYGVGNFDVFNLELLRGVMEAQRALRAPVILAYGPPFEGFSPMRHFTKLMRSYAEETDLPVVIHLDHANTVEQVRQAVTAGFNSVMIDASAMSFEENIQKTKEVVAYCRPLGIPVEAELGHVGEEGMTDLSNYDYTDPALAAEYVGRTEIDALAVAIGNAHGVYRKKPEIRYDVLAAVRKAVDVPLVLHGASGIPDEDIRRCCGLGITKINIHTELLLSAVESFRQDAAAGADYYTMFENHVSAVQARTEEKIRLFGSQGKA
ncbi:MAG: class II fructose-bisphosphate aldolase [Eubacteriales bacterium]|nr:class II fructose-bisphosphate aldolase [Eubacteriales bacterium]MDD3537519.1 class II fructose-bisphosphate aldolase [Eubacteriales bacterium]MDD4285977.1 class II fructose-bisphosphate aldolase [Eubacteriales bacterium]